MDVSEKSPLLDEQRQDRQNWSSCRRPQCPRETETPHARTTDDSRWTAHREAVVAQSSRTERISEALYGTCEDTQTPTRSTTQQPRRLPHHVQVVINAMLGIQPPAGVSQRRPYLAHFLHVVTLLSAAVYIGAFTWYTAYDIVSKYTKRTALTGVAGIVMSAYWCSLGLYARQLAKRLYADPRLLSAIRMHSRTVAAVGLGYLITGGAVSFTVTTAVNAAQTLDTAHCHKVSVPSAVCLTTLVARIVHSVMSLMWNLIVGGLLISVCRTHTIGIRRFVRALEHDAKIHESRYSSMYRWRPPDEGLNSDCDDDFLWDDTDIPLITDNNDEYRQPAHETNATAPLDGQDEVLDNPMSYQQMAGGATSQDADAQDVCLQNPVALMEKTYVDIPEAPSSVCSLSVSGRETFTVDDILMRYWKILHRLRETSECLQRWLVAWVLFIVAWTASFIVWWIGREATLIGIANFLLPILLLPLVCSAFADVNNEGKRIVKCIYPTEERLHLLSILHKQPLEMTVFSFPVNYSAIVTTLGALAVAFCSRIVLDEIKM